MRSGRGKEKEKGEDMPDCTGVKTGVTLVNSESKLLVSVALVICGKKGAGILLW
jgi:hypothetical protein